MLNKFYTKIYFRY